MVAGRAVVSMNSVRCVQTMGVWRDGWQGGRMRPHAAALARIRTAEAGRGGPFERVAPTRRSAQRLRCALLALCLGAGACGDPMAPPVVPRPDAGPPSDAGPPGDGGVLRPVVPILPHADDEITLPFETDTVYELEVPGTPTSLDVHFSIDTTSSFQGEIDALQERLVSEIIPALRQRVDDIAFGVSRFEDFPREPFGGEDDRPYELLSPIDTRVSRVVEGIEALDMPLGFGGDFPEAGYEALYQIATGAGGPSGVAAFSAGGLGGVGFRPNAFHVVVHATDATSHTPESYGDAVPGTHGFDEVSVALNAIDAHLIGIVTSTAPRPELESLALATGATSPTTGGACRTGIDGEEVPPRDDLCPLVFDANGDGSGLAGTIVDSIGTLLDALLHTELWLEADADPIGFVQHIEADSSSIGGGETAPGTADLRPVDGIPDTFTEVRSAATLRFRVVLRNDRIVPQDYPQSFRITLRTLADGQPVGEHVLRVVLPAR